MSRKTHEKELARARAKRHADRSAQQRTRRTVGAGIVVVVAVAAIAVGFALQGGDDEPDPVATGAEPCENPSDGAPEPDTSLQYEEPPPTEGVADSYTVTLTTTCGEVVMELDGAAAPQTVASFAFLAEEGYYGGVPFHRVQDQFVIQGGDPTGTGSGGPGYTFEDELELAQQVTEANDGLYPRGTVAMANAGADTNGSQFFIVQADPGYAFPPDYAVFGQVTEGMDVVDRIAQGPVTGPSQDQAVDPVRILSVEVTEG